MASYMCNCTIERVAPGPCDGFNNTANCRTNYCQQFRSSACFSNSTCEIFDQGYNCTCPAGLLVSSQAETGVSCILPPSNESSEF